MHTHTHLPGQAGQKVRPRGRGCVSKDAESRIYLTHREWDQWEYCRGVCGHTEPAPIDSIDGV